jgi:hypothetical protein
MFSSLCPCSPKASKGQVHVSDSMDMGAGSSLGKSMDFQGKPLDASDIKVCTETFAGQVFVARHFV